MKISKRHQRLSNELKNPRVLDNPEEFLGPNWKAVLNFWIYLDTLTDEQCEVIDKRIDDMNEDEWFAAYKDVVKAAEKTTPYWNDVGGNATLEIIGFHELLKQQKPFIFLPLYLNP